jgi:predicted lipoprotein with Yx(FWY)xxD motif
MNASHIGRTALVSAALVLLASCGSSDASSDSGDLVSVASVDGAKVLVDARDHTLYSAEVEKDAQIHCVDACTSFWEPVLASADDVDNASKDLRDALGIVKRPEGESQLTYDGLPLYTFAKEGAGELTGDGFTDEFQGTAFVWAAATTDASTKPSGTPSSVPDYGY